MRLVFIHPDLGVGGAERLIVDAAIACKSKGHQVTILTSHYDQNHCFEDTKQLDIIVKANSLPRNLFGKFHAFFAYLKIFLAALWLIYQNTIEYDCIICDQISIPVLVFKLFSKANTKVLFYCHFPDQLLCVYDKKRSPFKRLYRIPINWLESISTAMSDVILVNSNFTKQVFKSTWPHLNENKLKILYPSLNTEIFDTILAQNNDFNVDSSINNPIIIDNIKEFNKFTTKKFIFLSINRYERKKNIQLAIDMMLKLKTLVSEDVWKTCHLIHAGGYDHRVEENVDYYKQLNEYIISIGLQSNISLLRSISDLEKVNLLKRAYCLIYTPLNEHFGIVPLEAMYCEKPVLATNTGGPLETVVNNVTGYLIDADPNVFAFKLYELVCNTELQRKMGCAARKRVIEKFSYFSFTQQLNNILNEMVISKKND